MSLRFKLPRKDASLDFAKAIPVTNPRRSNARLNFDQPRQSGGSLEFAIGSESQTPVIELTGQAQQQSMQCAGALTIMQAITAGDIQIEQPVITGELDYDINVDRSPKLFARADHWRNRADIAKSRVTSTFGAALRSKQRVAAKHHQGDCLPAYAVSDWQRSLFRKHQTLSRWQLGTVAQQHVAGNYQQCHSHFTRYSSSYQQGVITQTHTQSSWQNPDAAYHAVTEHWQLSAPLYSGYSEQVAHGEQHRFGLVSHYQQATYPSTWRKAPVIEPPTPHPEQSAALNFLALRQFDAHLEFIPIELDAFIVMNEITCSHIAPDETETALHPSGVSLNLDIDAFSYELTGTLHGKEQLAYLRQTADGPATIAITINGYAWRFIVKEYQRTREQLGTSYRFTAVSQSQFLGEPYASKTSGSVESVIGAWQLAQQQLDPLGFNLVRHEKTPDWTLAAGSYQYTSKTPIELLADIAKAAGAVLVPEREQSTLNVQPRYRVSPWHWQALTDAECDHAIPEYLMVTESGSNQSSEQLNAVTISGVNSGVSTEVVLAGTAGDSQADDVVDPLAQDHNVNAERGRNIMADSGEVELVGYKLPLAPEGEPGALITAGDICRIQNEDGSNTTGLCLSNKLDASSLTDVWQNITLELHH